MLLTALGNTMFLKTPLNSYKRLQLTESTSVNVKSLYRKIPLRDIFKAVLKT